jgi:AcrR family transcriptional regulator
VPKLWNDTIEEHRRAVHMAILDTAASLTAQHGLTGVTMSQIAQATGIGRATLYKYFPDVEAILMAWHERQVTGHLHELAAIGEQGDDPGQRLHAVLRAYARIQHEHHGHDLAAVLHRGEHMVSARQHLRGFLAGLLAEATAAGQVRDDVAPGELADFCLHALTAAGGLPSKAAVDRLVTVTLAGLRPQR